MRLILTRALATVAVVGAMTLGARLSMASITTGDLAPGVNWLEDDDFEGGILRNGTTLEVGDTLFGIFQIQTLYDYNDPNNPIPLASNPVGPGTTFTGIFASTVLTKSPGGAPYSWTFGAASDAVWDGLFGVGSRSSSDVAVKVFQDSSNPRIANGNLSSPNGLPIWEFGFVGAGTNWVASGPSDNPLLLTEFANPITGALGPVNFGIALNQVSGSPLAKHDTLNFGVPTHLQGFGSVWAQGGNAVTPLRSDTDFFIATPEPATVAVWGALALIGGGFAAARRRMSAA